MRSVLPVVYWAALCHRCIVIYKAIIILYLFKVSSVKPPLPIKLTNDQPLSWIKLTQPFPMIYDIEYAPTCILYYCYGPHTVSGPHLCVNISFCV